MTTKTTKHSTTGGGHRRITHEYVGGATRDITERADGGVTITDRDYRGREVTGEGARGLFGILEDAVRLGDSLDRNRE